MKNKINRKGVFREENGLTLFISNEDTNDIIKIIKLSEDSRKLIDGITERIKHEIKRRKRIS